MRRFRGMPRTRLRIATTSVRTGFAMTKGGSLVLVIARSAATWQSRHGRTGLFAATGVLTECLHGRTESSAPTGVLTECPHRRLIAEAAELSFLFPIINESACRKLSARGFYYAFFAGYAIIAAKRLLYYEIAIFLSGFAGNRKIWLILYHFASLHAIISKKLSKG